jgi:hypothetical protein
LIPGRRYFVGTPSHAHQCGTHAVLWQCTVHVRGVLLGHLQGAPRRARRNPRCPGWPGSPRGRPRVPAGYPRGTLGFPGTPRCPGVPRGALGQEKFEFPERGLQDASRLWGLAAPVLQTGGILPEGAQELPEPRRLSVQNGAPRTLADCGDWQPQCCKQGAFCGRGRKNSQNPGV